jgi:hypothetical protein
MGTKPLTDLDGVAHLLKVPVRQAKELWHRGCFPGIKLSHKYLRFDPDEVLEAVKAHRKGMPKHVAT